MQNNSIVSQMKVLKSKRLSDLFNFIKLESSKLELELD